MRRHRVLWSAVALLLVAVVVVAAAWPRVNSDATATYKVEPTQFSRRVTAEGTLRAVKATPIITPATRQPLKLAWIAEDGALLRKGEVVVRFDPTDFENLLLNGREDDTTANNKLKKANTDAKTTRTNLKRDANLAQNELESAQKFKFDDAEIFSRYQRIESELDEKLAGDRKQHAEEVLGVRETIAAAERDLLGIETRKAMLKIRNAEDGLKSLEIVAPHDGILVLKRDWRGDVPRVGTTTWAGNPLGEIPELTSMEAEVFVLEADAAGLAVDQKAHVSLESHPGSAFNGKVKSVDKLARPRIRGVPVQYFGVVVTIEKTDPKMMKPGSRVRAVLEVENQKDAFAVPRQALFEKDGKRLAYRRNGDTFEPVEVQIGSATAGRIVVTKGLKAGDQLALKDPTAETDESK
ncbi:MAG TPA: HlyD family efflux transporter periplasmic adaptor subunit [Thermoanaerobaculia bacterium]